MLFLRHGFPFGLALLVQTEWLTSQPWESPDPISVVLGLQTQASVPVSPAFMARTLLTEPPPHPSIEQKEPQTRVLPVVLKVVINSSFKLISGSFGAFTVCCPF